MSRAATELLAVYIDGETKTGKGSAGQAIAQALENVGLHVYYDVAGDFFRRYVALVRMQLGLNETDALPTGQRLEAAAITVYERRRVFEHDDSLGDLQRPAIATSVSVLGELTIAHKAGAEWWVMSTERAKTAGADIMVMDGRNPRSRMHDQKAVTGITVRTALDLYMVCDAEEAARRSLLTRGVGNPDSHQIKTEREAVMRRRSKDRQRGVRPFVEPANSVSFIPGETSVQQVLDQSWRKHQDAELPVTITLDNTQLTKPAMLSAVSELAAEAVKFVVTK